MTTGHHAHCLVSTSSSGFHSNISLIFLMLKKLEVIHTDSLSAIWLKMKICKNIDRPQAQEGELGGRRHMEAMERNKVSSGA